MFPRMVYGTWRRGCWREAGKKVGSTVSTEKTHQTRPLGRERSCSPVKAPLRRSADVPCVSMIDVDDLWKMDDGFGGWRCWPAGRRNMETGAWLRRRWRNKFELECFLSMTPGGNRRRFNHKGFSMPRGWMHTQRNSMRRGGLSVRAVNRVDLSQSLGRVVCTEQSRI